MPGDLFDPTGELDDDLVDDDDWDEETNDLLYLKYCFEGAPSLDALAAMLRSLADDLDRRAAEGWSLIAPIDGGHGHLVRFRCFHKASPTDRVRSEVR